MNRLWIGIGAAVLFVLWLLFLRTWLILIGLAVIVGGGWIWWEIHALKKAMRKPPDR